MFGLYSLHDLLQLQLNFTKYFPPHFIDATTSQGLTDHLNSYWECLKEGILPQLETKTGEMQRLHDVIRKTQTADLKDKYNMSPLHIKRTTISQSFDGQVLCTPDIYLAKKIILIVHDPQVILPFAILRI